MTPLRRPAREEGGFTLVELLIAMTLLVVVLGATLTTFDTFTRRNIVAADRSAANDRVRTGIDRLARELRNLASPTKEATQAIDVEKPYDLVFKTVNPKPSATSTANTAQVRRVRYCLEDGGTRLLFMQQAWDTAVAPAAPATTACSLNDTAWPSRVVLAQDVVNRTGREAPIFTYDAPTNPLAVRHVSAQVYVDADASRAPGATRLRTGVFLRNQNQAPVAAFTWRDAGNGRVLLNGSPSQDPEGDPLQYVWWARVGTEDRKIGDQVTCDCPAGAEGLPRGTYPMYLKVYDASKLEGVSATQAVTLR